MPFNIQNQTSQITNNVEGNMTVHGGQHVVVGLAEVREAAEALRGEVAGLPLPGPQAEAARREATAVVDELRRTEPDKGRVAALLERLAAIVKPAVAVVGSVAGVVGPLTVLAGWLGQYAGPLTGVLAGLV